MRKDNINKKSKFKKAVISGVLAGTVLTSAGLAVKQHQDNKKPNNNRQNIQTENVIQKVFNKQSNDMEYIVKPGDTLYDICEKYYGSGMFYNEVADYNNMENASKIKAGDIIKLPKVVGENTHLDENPIIEYRINSGDSLYSICEKYYKNTSNETIQRLANYNNIENINNIREGQIINVPEFEELLKVQAYPYDYEYDNMMKK